jgi:outer membrane protein assembly factor BamD (BamD/ComL family)
MRREMTWFAFGLAIIIGVFAIVILKGPTDLSDTAILESQQHFEEAKKAVSNGDMELALTHLEAIHKRTPAWYDSRELHWKVKEEVNKYARARSRE